MKASIVFDVEEKPIIRLEPDSDLEREILRHRGFDLGSIFKISHKLSRETTLLERIFPPMVEPKVEEVFEAREA